MSEPSQNAIFDDDGKLRLGLFSKDAREVLSQTAELLVELGRKMFLPLDLMIVLIERGHPEIIDVISTGTDGSVEPVDVLVRLKALAKEIEEESEGKPALDRGSFSRGFSRILSEAHQQTSKKVAEADLVRNIIWRAEAVESASVRWAIRRLGEGGGDVLFEKRGLLREEVFDKTMWGLLQGSMIIAAENGTPFLGTPHLVAMICSVKNSTIWRSARARGLEPSRLREELLRLIGSKPSPIPEFHIGRKTLTPRMVRMLSHAVRKAGTQQVGESHIVDSFLEDGGSSLELVQALGLDSEIRRALGEPKVLEEALPVEAAIMLGARRESTPTLDLLGRDLTAEALEGKLPEIVGRETELRRVINVLLRKEQRNPLLTGEAGVGKTALAVALAQLITSGKVPRKLRGHRLVELNGASLMSGTSYRGDLESRIKGLLEEAGKDVILFIDEAHAVFAPRAGGHAPAEVPNHFKSALASGRIAVVAATTEAEYRRWFEQDPALKRRFERIEIGEPSDELVREILTSVVADLETEYEVQVDPEAIDAAIELSVRYVPEQRLPDKAKKLLMDACIALANGLTEPAGDRKLVGRQDVAKQVNLKTSIPLDRLMRGEMSWWHGFEDRLKSDVVGQDDAIGQIARALVGGRLRRARQNRAMAVLVFVGPSGVGKATLAMALAAEVFSDERAVIRLDMTDFQESHSMSRLIGSPPGYVGYEDEDMLVTPLRRRPSSVVMLEDFDRAHPRIQDRMLRVIDEGEITDTRGYCADASNAIFVLTVNTAAQKQGGKIGFGGGDTEAAITLLEQHDSVFAARIQEHVDGIIPFRTLSVDGGSPVAQLVERRIGNFVNALRDEYLIEVEISEAVQQLIVELASESGDASSIESLVGEHLFDPVTNALLSGTVGAAMKIELEDGSVVLSYHAD